MRLLRLEHRVATRVLLALVAMSLFTIPAQGDDHLVPEAGEYSFPGQRESYHHELAKRLVGDLRCEVLMVTVPSFEPEHALCVTDDVDGPIVRRRSLAPMLWVALKQKRVAEVKVSEVSAPLDRETLRLLRDAWIAALRRVRHPDAGGAGLDGEAFHFLALDASKGLVMTGRAWSPENGTAVGELVALGQRLESFAQAPADARKGLVAGLREAAQRVEARMAATDGPREEP